MRQLIVTVFGAAAIAVVFAPAAMAADMPVKAPMYTKAPAFIADPWTGFYLGASAGGRWNKDTWTGTGFQSPAVPTNLTSRDNPHDFTTTSARFGLYGGYNWRIQQTWVVGLEADFAWASNKNSSAGIPGLDGGVGGFAPNDSVQMKDTWDGGVRGRVGYLITPTMLLFGTGGASWMRSQASITCTTGAGWCSGTNLTSGRTDSVSKTVVGWTVGGGLEAVVAPNWLLRGEYRYSSYAGYHATLLQGGSSGGGNIDVVDADIKTRTQTVLVGLAYKFGQ
jgi:outer membrane immunogenic protein